jgi:hypothetical protein
MSSRTFPHSLHLQRIPGKPTLICACASFNAALNSFQQMLRQSASLTSQHQAIFAAAAAAAAAAASTAAAPVHRLQS